MKLNLKLYSKKEGFTLIELLFSIVISGIVLISISYLLSSTLNSMKTNNKKINSVNGAYLFFEIVRKEIEGADFINTNKNNNSLGFGIIQNIGEKNVGKKEDKKIKLELKYIYFAYENKALYRIAQSSTKSYENNDCLVGDEGRNMIIDNVDDIKVNFTKDKIIINMIFNNNKYERVYAIRSRNE